MDEENMALPSSILQKTILSDRDRRANSEALMALIQTLHQRLVVKLSTFTRSKTFFSNFVTTCELCGCRF